MNYKDIRKIYSLLNGMNMSLTNDKYIYDEMLNQFNDLLYRFIKLTGDTLLDQYNINLYNYRERYMSTNEFKNYLVPVLNYIRENYLEDENDEIARIGSIFNSLKDNELKDRCGDILLGKGSFDRAINQATQILEDRIKVKASLKKSGLIGLPLVSKAIHSKCSETILKYSDDSDIQEGFSMIIKGIVSVYRNQTHHGFDFECSRDYALKVVSFIDSLLLEIDECSVNIKE